MTSKRLTQKQFDTLFNYWDNKILEFIESQVGESKEPEEFIELVAEIVTQIEQTNAFGIDTMLSMLKAYEDTK